MKSRPLEVRAGKTVVGVPAQIGKAVLFCVGFEYPFLVRYGITAGENRILKGIEEIDVLKERYRQAVEFMEWFQPAWNTLSDEEQVVLELFYISGDGNQTDAVLAICERFYIERSSAYKKKDRALTHLAVLLYGK